MSDPKRKDDQKEFISNVVDESRQRGVVLHEQYTRAESDGTWSKESDGTIRFADSKVEITAKGDVFGSYKDLTSFMKDHGLSGSRGDGLNQMEIHHLLAAESCKSAGINAKTAPCVAVDASGHMNDLHDAAGIQAGTLYKDVEHMKAEHRSVYSSLGAPEWGERAAEFIESQRPKLEASLEREQRELATKLPDPVFNSGTNEPARDDSSETKFEPSAVVDCHDSNASKY